MDMNHNVFVSSTFQDMHAERDLLHRHVIPELLFKYSKYHLHLEVVDLRWGIDTSDDASEAESTNKILRVCFDEINRSQPFFFAFVGERYGWIPSAEDVESALLGYNADFLGKDHLGVTEMEILYALTQKPDAVNCFFFIRNGLKPEEIANEETRRIYFPTDAVAVEKSRQLKEFLRTHYGANTFEYHCRWDATAQKVVGLEPLAELIIQQVSGVLDRQLAAYALSTEQDAFYEEAQLQQYVCSTQAEHLMGRDEELAAVTEAYLAAPTAEVAVIAPSGIGKSTLLSGLCQKAAVDGWRVLPFWAGISEMSRDFSYMARYLCAQLEPSLKQELAQWPYDRVKKQLYLSLKEHAAQQNILIVIDAVNQFRDPYALDTMDWLDALIIPDGVRVVYSGLPENEELFTKRGATLYRLEGIHPSRILEVARGLAARLHKELPQSAESLLLQKTNAQGEQSCCHPMYLVALMELLCSFDADDYRNIAVKQSSGALSPAEAINQYICAMLTQVGSTIEDVLLALIQKSDTQLGDKFCLISALLTSAPFGMDEQDMMAIINYADPQITSADFSLYRRMFRMHIQQRNSGRWMFNHNVVRSVVAAYIIDYPFRQLWKNAAAYYSKKALVNPEEARYAALYLAKAEDYRGLIDLCTAETAPYCAETIFEVLKYHAFDFWSRCSRENEPFLCQVLVRYCADLAAEDPVTGVRCLTTALRQLLNSSCHRKEQQPLIAELYAVCGELLLQIDTSQAKSFLEIAMHLLMQAPVGGEMCHQMAVRICRVLNSAQHYFEAETYAKIAYDLAQAMPAQATAQAAYQWARCIQSNSFSLRKGKAPKLFLQAMHLAIKEEDWELIGAAALGYLRCGGLFTRKAQRVQAQRILEELPQNAVSSALLVEIQLYLTSRRPTAHAAMASEYGAIIPTVCEALAQDNSIAVTGVFQDVWEHYAYALMLRREPCAEEVRAAVTKADAACRKLGFLTNLVSWQDRRIALSNDLTAYLTAYDERVEERDIPTLPKAKRRAQDPQASAVRTITIYSCLAVLVLVAIVEFAMAWFTKQTSDSSWLFTVFTDLCETVANVLAVVSLFYAALMLRTQDKNSHRYRSYRAGCLSYSLLFVGALILNVFTGSITLTQLYDPFAYDKYLFASVFSMVLSVAYCMALVWVLPSLLSRLIDRSAHHKTQECARHLYRRKEIRATHVGLAAVSSIGLVLSLLGLAIPYLDRVELSLALWNTLPKDFLAYCWVPLLLQMVLSVAEVCRYPKAARLSKGNKWFYPTRVVFPAVLLVLATAAVVVTASVSKEMGREIQYEEHQYYVKDGVHYKVDEQGAYAYHYWQDDDAVYDLVMPKKIGAHTVYHIAPETFYDANVRSVCVPDTMTTIGASAFAQCHRLEKVQLPHTIISFEDGAFSSCTSLTQINIPASLEYIGAGAFKYCYNLTSLSADKEQEIQVFTNAFSDSGIAFSDECTRQGFYVLGASIVYVDQTYAGIIRIPEGVRTIPEKAFQTCGSITQVYLPDGLTRIESKAFVACGSLYYVRLPASLESMGEEAFLNCTKLLFVDNHSLLPIETGSEEYGEVGKYAWCVSKDGTALPEETEDGLRFARDPQSGQQMLVAVSHDRWQLVLPETYLGEEYAVRDDALSGMYRRYSLILPQRKLGDAWYKNRSCAEIVHPGQESTVYVDEQGLLLEQSGGNLLVYGYVGTDTAADLVLDGYESVSVMPNAFANELNVRSITIRGNMWIHEDAFRNCRGLERVTLSGDLYLGSNVFYNCCSLQEVVMDGSICDSNSLAEDVLPNGSFENCVRLSRVTLPHKVTAVQSGAFKHCVSLTQIALPDVTLIGESVFFGCTELKSVSLGVSLTQVASNAFEQCRSLERVEYGGKVEQWMSILFEDEYASPFASDGYCKLYVDGAPVVDVVVEDAITEITAFSFYNYRWLRSVDLGNTVKTIGESAFLNCESLEKVSGYDALEVISPRAFAYCDGLRTLPFGENLNKIRAEAFMDCDGLVSVYIPANVKTLGDHIFQSCDCLERIAFPEGWESRKKRLFGEDISPEYVPYVLEET